LSRTGMYSISLIFITYSSPLQKISQTDP